LVADRFLVKKQQTLFEKMELTDLRKSKILEEIDADTELIALVYLSSAISVWQDDRKKMTFFATHYFTLILERVARYFACTLEELKYLTCLEVENLLANDRALSFPLNRRVQNCAFVWHESSVDVFTDEDLISTLKDTVRVKDDFILNELKGLIASPGKVVGRVRVLDVIEKLDDFENDEILVAVMTRPDFLSAMKKAKAIVTDEGGVTSHAAVLSREFNIPCVVGTKMATNYLRDGDFVEVDAFNGIVKKLPN